ncbi:hypothetical protein [Terrabacter sp. 2RAF25]|uniref:hypothetical protein n=1 Tax=Terrabacter sp. 2RAF25 TaxID=3232998 RepID=UPI003F9A1750
MADRDLDAEFERIIAGWDDEAPDPQRTPPSVSTETPGADGTTRSDPTGTLTDGADPAAQTVAVDPLAPEAQPSERPEATPPTAPSSTPSTPSTPSPSPTDGSERLELPIAPTTSHAWRGNSPRRDDADALLDASDPDDDHFVPPSEIDLPSAETDPMFWAIVGGLVGGPLLLLYVLFFDRDGSGWWVVTALAMVVVGFVLLVLRGGTERDPFDDGTRV